MSKVLRQYKLHNTIAQRRISHKSLQNLSYKNQPGQVHTIRSYYSCKFRFTIMDCIMSGCVSSLLRAEGN